MTVYSGVLPASALSQGGGPRHKHKGVFVAYRFNHADSKAFYESVLADIRRVNLGIVVHDGHVGSNADWAETIRERLKQCSVILADVETYSKEIMFELGFAAQLGLALMPTRVGERRGPIPRWLMRLQYQTWPEHRGQMIDDACRFATTERQGNAFRSGRAVTDKCFALNVPRELHEIVHAQCSAMDLIDVPLSPDGEEPPMGREAFRAASQSGLVVVGLQATRADSYSHFIAGSVAAQPTIWGGRGRRRKIVLVHPEGLKATDIVADALLRVDGLVSLVSSGAELVRAIESWKRSGRD